jgi:hypothetical protein
MVIRYFSGLICGGVLSFLSTTMLSAQQLRVVVTDFEVSIGINCQTVAHAVVLRYGYFHYVPRHSSSSNRQAQAFHIAQPKLALPSTQPSRHLAFNSEAADYRSDYKPQQQYYDKYSLSIRAKP